MSGLETATFSMYIARFSYFLIIQVCLGEIYADLRQEKYFKTQMKENEKFHHSFTANINTKGRGM